MAKRKSHPPRPGTVAFLLLALGASFATAATPVGRSASANGRALLDYSLDELLAVRVETASRASEDLRRTAATVYVITADEIRTYGYRNLADVLENVPGFIGVSGGLFLNGGQRGLLGNFSQTLLLVNGREFQGLATQEIFISDQFALDNIRQIEVMNSPGSVLHGANAFSGVINILTRDADPEFTGQQARFSLGSENTQAISLVGASRSESGRFSYNLRQYRSDNWDFGAFVADRERFSAGFPAVVQDASARAGQEFGSRNQARNWALRFEKNGFYLGTDGYYLESGKSIGTVAMDYDSQHDTRDLSLWYAGWRGNLQDGELIVEYQFLRDRFWGSAYEFNNAIWQGLLVNGRDPDAPITQDEIYQDFQLFYSQENSPGSQRHRAHTQFQKHVSATSELTVGVVGEHRDLVGAAMSTSDPSPPFDMTLADSNPMHRPIYRSHKTSGYLQWRARLPQQLDLTLGARLDDHSQYGTVSTLRGGLVWQQRPTTHWHLRYGEAFREPNAFELALYKPAGSGRNPDLQPATIAALEFGLMQQLDDTQRLQITAFDNDAEAIVPTGTTTFTNRPQHIRGVETEYDYRAGRWRLDGAWAWMQPGKTRVAGQAVDSLNVYEHRLALGAAFLPRADLSLALRANYFDKLAAEDGNPRVNRVIAIPSAVRLDASAGWQTSLLRAHDVRFDLGIRNLTDKRYYQANVRNTGPVEFLQPGRQFLLNLTLQF